MHAPRLSFILAILGVVSLSACQAAPERPVHSATPHAHAGENARPIAAADSAARGADTRVLDLSGLSDVSTILPVLSGRRVVYVGEVHDRLHHHLSQLAVISGLHAANTDLAIGVEFFQQPFQPYLDEFIAGRLDEKGFLKKSEYYSRWRFDYRLYRPILDFARANAIPVVALNVATEIVDKVSEGGIEGLSEAERAQVPADLDRSDERYIERLRTVFEHHPKGEDMNFDRFVTVQLLWDEGMAERAARYLQAHPRRTLVVLAGNGHLAWGAGIPARVKRRLGVEGAVILTGGGNEIEPGIADFLLLPEPQELPRAGLLGVLLETPGEGVVVGSFSESSAAEEAGVRSGDRILALDRAPIHTLDDVKIAMLDRRPGDEISVAVRRNGWLSGARELRYTVRLR